MIEILLCWLDLQQGVKCNGDIMKEREKLRKRVDNMAKQVKAAKQVSKEIREAKPR